jgi:hypothetical protein
MQHSTNASYLLSCLKFLFNWSEKCGSWISPRKCCVLSEIWNQENKYIPLFQALKFRNTDRLCPNSVVAQLGRYQLTNLTGFLFFYWALRQIVENSERGAVVIPQFSGEFCIGDHDCIVPLGLTSGFAAAAVSETISQCHNTLSRFNSQTTIHPLFSFRELTARWEILLPAVLNKDTSRLSAWKSSVRSLAFNIPKTNFTFQEFVPQHWYNPMALNRSVANSRQLHRKVLSGRVTHKINMQIGFLKIVVDAGIPYTHTHSKGSYGGSMKYLRSWGGTIVRAAVFSYGF